MPKSTSLGLQRRIFALDCNTGEEVQLIPAMWPRLLALRTEISEGKHRPRRGSTGDKPSVPGGECRGQSSEPAEASASQPQEFFHGIDKVPDIPLTGRPSWRGGTLLAQVMWSLG